MAYQNLFGFLSKFRSEIDLIEFQARLWRKTRSDHGSILGCRGTDANRNFGYHWNGKLFIEFYAKV